VETRLSLLQALRGSKPDPDSDRISEELIREERFQKLGTFLSILRVVLVIAVQFLLLLGFSLIYVHPPSPAFYIAILSLAIDALFLAGSLALFFFVRKKMRGLMGK
jgi:hypothetical protein